MLKEKIYERKNEMRGTVWFSMVLIFLGCTKSNKLEVEEPIKLDSTLVCINSIEQLKLLNNGLDTFKISRVILEDGSEVRMDDNLSVAYSAQTSSGGSSLFDSTLKIRVKENDVTKTYYSNVWSKGCRNSQNVEGLYTNLMSGDIIYLVNTYFNWTVPPYGAGGLRIKYLVME